MSDELEKTPESPEILRDRIKRALKAKRRLAALERLDLLDSAHDVPALNRAARVTARALRTPVAQINLLGEQMQVPVAAFTEPGDDSAPWTAPRRVGHSLCKFVLITKGPLVVNNAREDPLVRNAYATDTLKIGAYLGAPIRTPGEGDRPGPIVGTVCVVSNEPREWSAADVETIVDIANGVSEQVTVRMNQRAAVRSGTLPMLSILEHVAVGVLATDANGVTTFANAAAESILGIAGPDLLGRDQHAIIHHSRPDGTRYPEMDCPHYMARRDGRMSEVTSDVFWRGDGEPVPVHVTMLPIIERGEVIGSVVTFQALTSSSSRE